MNVLVLAPAVPWPLDSGSKIRMYHVIKGFREAGYKVTLACLSNSRSIPAAISRICDSVYVVPHRTNKYWSFVKGVISRRSYHEVLWDNQEFRVLVSRILNSDNVDLVWVNFLGMVPYVTDWAVKGRRKAKIALDEHNNDVGYWESFQYGGVLAGFLGRVNVRAVKRLQRMVRDRLDVLVCVSSSEAREAQRTWLHGARTHVIVLPNGADLTRYYQRPDPKVGNRIILCGSMDVEMNVLAATYFARHVFPRVQERVPDAELWIVGRNPARRVRELERIRGIRVTGTVEDVRPYYEAARIAVVPQRVGAGTKLKVFEACSMGVPVVCTVEACRTIDRVEESGIIVVGNDDEFVHAIVELLVNSEKRIAVGRQERQWVEKYYSWERVTKRAIDLLTQ